MAYIYKIINDINDKIYIGQTIKTLDERFKIHIRDSKQGRCEKRPLYNAFNKYGIEHFKIELVEEVEENLLNEREQYWIQYYNSYGNNGYNATLGGDTKLLYNHNEIKQRLQEHPYMADIAKEFNCDIAVIKNVARTNNIAVKTAQEIAKERYSKPVIQLDKNTEENIQQFSSLMEAATWIFNNKYGSGDINGIRAHIRDVCNGKRKTAYTFKWKYIAE